MKNMKNIFNDEYKIFAGEEQYSFDNIPEKLDTIKDVEKIIDYLHQSLIRELIDLMTGLDRYSLLKYISLLSCSGLPNFSGHDNGAYLTNNLTAKEQSMIGRVLLEVYSLSAPASHGKEVHPEDFSNLIEKTAYILEVNSAKELVISYKNKKYNGKIKPYMGGISISQSLVSKKFNICYNPLFFDIRNVQKNNNLIDADEEDIYRIANIRHGRHHDRENLSIAIYTYYHYDLQDFFNVLTELANYLRIIYDNNKIFPENHIFIEMSYEGYIENFSNNDKRRKRVLDYLIFSNEKMSIMELRPAGTRHQKFRIVTNPIIKVEDKVYLVGSHILNALHRWMQYIRIGDWPLPDSIRKNKYPLLNKELKKIRNYNGKVIFEKKVENYLIEKSIIFGKFGDGARLGNCVLPGEVDGLILDPIERRIIILECKDIASDMNVLSMQAELLNFEFDYTPKIKEKIIQVEMDKISVAEAIISYSKDKFDIQYQGPFVDDTWRVEGLFIVRDGSPAMYYNKIEYPILPFREFRKIYF